MRLVVALGGNALLPRGAAMSLAAQQSALRRAAQALAPLVLAHEVLLTHGNGPQIGLLALREAAAGAAGALPPGGPVPLDVLGAESEGMIGYLLEQELDNALPDDRVIASLLTRVLVDRDDPAFARPTKFIGPGYDRAEAEALARRHGWTIGRDGAAWRRTVPSPAPVAILEARAISLLLRHGATVICAGGGGIPVVARPDGGHEGVEAVIDKDLASALIARLVAADGLVMLTDVPGVALDFGGPGQRWLRRAAPAALRALDLPAGSMGPKVQAACDFVAETGGFAVIGALEQAAEVLAGRAGTRIELAARGLETAG